MNYCKDTYDSIPELAKYNGMKPEDYARDSLLHCEAVIISYLSGNVAKEVINHLVLRAKAYREYICK